MSKDRNYKVYNFQNYVFGVIFLVTLNFIGILICVYFLLGLNLIKIINVEGNREVPSQDIINASGLRTNDSVFQIFTDQKKIRGKVKKKIPQINQISIELHNFNHADIEVTEFGVVGYIQVKNHFRKVFTNGEVDYHLRSKTHENRPIFDQFSSKKEISQIAEIYQKIPPAVRSNISEIKLTHSKVNPNQIIINMNDGNVVIGDLTTIKDKIADYSFLIKGKKGKLIIDLEVGIFVRSVK